MSEEQNNAVINLLTNLSRDSSQIKTDLAVNTTKTTAIEEHLRVLNGKVLKHDQELVELKEQVAKNADFRKEALKERDTHNIRFYSFMEKILWAIIPAVAVGIWQLVQFFIKNDVSKIIK